MPDWKFLTLRLATAADGKLFDSYAGGVRSQAGCSRLPACLSCRSHTESDHDALPADRVRVIDGDHDVQAADRPVVVPQALQLLFAEEAGDWYAASASPALHQAAATAYDALLAARHRSRLAPVVRNTGQIS